MGLVIDYEYDPITGLPSHITRTAVATAESFATALTHDANGNLTHSEEFGRPTEDYQYAADGRLLSKTITLDPSSGSMPLVTNYLYSDAGELEVEVELGPELDRYFVYTLRGLIERVEESPRGPAPARSQCMRYDARGQLVELVDAEGRRTYLERDAVGNVFRVRRGIPQTTSPLEWDDACFVRDGATTGEETFEEVLYARGLPILVRRGLAGPNTPLWVAEYEQDGYGRTFELYYSDRNVLVRHDRWVGAGARSSRLFRHDELGRLQDAWTASGLPTTGFQSGSISDQKLTNWTSGATRNESYTLNAADSWTGGAYGAQNLSITLSSTDQRYLTFNGPVVTDADGRTTALPDGRQYSYDGLGRMLGARTAQNAGWTFQ